MVAVGEILTSSLLEFCLQNEVPNSVTYRSLEPVFPLMLVKASDLNTRVAQGTIDRIVMLCNCFRAAPYAILPLVFKPARSTAPYKHSQSRIAIVARLVDEFGVSDRAEGKGTAGGIAFEVRRWFIHGWSRHISSEASRTHPNRFLFDIGHSRVCYPIFKSYQWRGSHCSTEAGHRCLQVLEQDQSGAILARCEAIDHRGTGGKSVLLLLPAHQSVG
jgi:hypothetical protein